MNNQP